MSKTHPTCWAWLCLALAQPALAQDKADTLGRIALSEVTVTATRSERVASAVPLPVTVITKAQIEQMGSQRLSQVLQEQTGLALVADHGIGLQLQGFAADYTLILIDGEPLIGRTAGTFDLTRVAVGSIERIEIVKGPASSLYGSEALGGVVNIITKKPAAGISGEARYRLGSNATQNGTVSLSGGRKKLTATAFYDRYQTGGYSLLENSSPTVAPATSHTVQGKVVWQPTGRQTVEVAGRSFTESAQAHYRSAVSESEVVDFADKSSQTDWNLTANHRYAANRWSLRSRFYASRYRAQSTIRLDSNGAIYDKSDFIQTFLRPEVQAEVKLATNATLTAGTGFIDESVQATRYDERKEFTTLYGFSQLEWRLWEKLCLLAGVRADRQSVYGGQVSPKLSASYKVDKWLTFQASAGRGFKAPDFRTLYLDWNNLVAGYSVYGSEELGGKLAALKAAGQLDEGYTPPALSAGPLKAERSWSFNGGFTLSPTAKGSLRLSAFHNEVQDLIETQIIARRTNGASIYSYYNLGHIYTQGLEAELNYRPSAWMELSGGYQYLNTGDRDVEAGLRNGLYFYRDPVTYDTRKIGKAEYGGLFGRSKHMVNAKVFAKHAKTGLSGSLRAIYRSRFGYADINGNGILDDAANTPTGSDQSEYVKGYVTLNASLAKALFKNRLELQAGADNLLNYRDAAGRIPTLPGRLWWVAVTVRLSGKAKTQS